MSERRRHERITLFCGSVLILFDARVQMFGRWNVLVGFTGGELFSNILKITESSYVTFSNGSTGLVMSEENRMWVESII